MCSNIVLFEDAPRNPAKRLRQDELNSAVSVMMGSADCLERHPLPFYRSPRQRKILWFDPQNLTIFLVAVRIENNHEPFGGPE